MFSAHRAGSDTGGVGPESSPISHLSETMKALLDTSPAQAARAALIFHIQNHQKGRRGSRRRGLRVGGAKGSLGKSWGQLPPGPFPSPSSSSLRTPIL